jgi:threonine efflux protein
MLSAGHGVVLASVLVVHVVAMISPGPNVLLVTQTAMSRTRRAGVLAALGIAAGAAVWSSAALFGLSVVFTQFAWPQRALKVLGGIYLLYLGIKLWRAADRPLGTRSAQVATVRSDGQAFGLGLLTNLTNPKALIFYGSIFATLLTPDLPTAVKLYACGIIVLNATLWHVGLACLFSTPNAQHIYGRMRRWIDRVAGSVLALFGLRLTLL